MPNIFLLLVYLRLIFSQQCTSGVVYTKFTDATFLTPYETNKVSNVSYANIGCSYDSYVRWETYLAAPFASVFKIFVRSLVYCTNRVWVDDILYIDFTQKPNYFVGTLNYANVTLSNSTLHKIRAEYECKAKSECKFDLILWHSCEYPFVQLDSFLFLNNNCTDYTPPFLNPLPQPPQLNVKASNGLFAAYYLGPNFEEFLFWRVDDQIDHRFSDTEYPPCLPIYEFISIRWVGFFQSLESGLYQMSLSSDDGANITILDTVYGSWGPHAFADSYFNLTLQSNTSYPMEMRYYNLGDTGKVRFGDGARNAYPSIVLLHSDLSVILDVTTPSFNDTTGPSANTTRPSTMIDPPSLQILDGLVLINGSLVVFGDLSITNSADLMILAGYINVTGCVSLGGRIDVTLTPSLYHVGRNISYVAIYASCFVEGTDFEEHNLRVVDECLSLENIKSLQDSRGYVLIFDMRSVCGDKGLSAGEIAAIVVCICVAVLVIIVAFSIPGIRKRLFPYSWK